MYLKFTYFCGEDFDEVIIYITPAMIRLVDDTYSFTTYCTSCTKSHTFVGNDNDWELLNEY